MLELIQRFDEAVLLLIQEYLRLHFFNPVMVFISTLGNAGLIWILLGLSLAIIPKTRRYGIFALISLLVCFLFNNLLLKNLVARPRPYTQLPDLIMLMPCPADHSFPSGHTCASFATAGSLCWTTREKYPQLWIPAIILAVLIGWSRLYVGVHYPTDVLTGAGVGLIGSYFTSKHLATLYDRLVQSRR